MQKKFENPQPDTNRFFTNPPAQSSQPSEAAQLAAGIPGYI